MNFYNENDPKAAAWLRELIAQKLIPAGIVDERSIEDITPHELKDFTQCHFFCGIAGWPLALSLAGWPDSKPIWSGSCPCQPFSQAGEGKGIADERHLWPAFKWLVQQCQPPVVIGEQVASKDGREWLAGVRADLEDLGYEVGAADLCAAGVAAPHLRQRLFWVADARHGQRGWPSEQQSGPENAPKRNEGTIESQRRSETGGMGNAGCQCDELGRGSGDVGRTPDQEQGEAQERQRGGDADSGSSTDHLGLADLQSAEREKQQPVSCGQQGGLTNGSGLVLPDSNGCESGSAATTPAGHGDSVEPASFWAESRFIECRDGKSRRIPLEPAIFPLASGLPYKLARRGTAMPALIKGAGNAIVPQLAAEFIKAFMQLKPQPSSDP